MNESNKVKDIISLLDAGYSREEIAEMLQEPAEDLSSEDIPAEEVPAEPEKAEEPAEPDKTSEIEELKKEIQSLKSLIQKQNLKQARVEQPPVQESASDILARLVNPNYGMDGGKLK